MSDPSRDDAPRSRRPHTRRGMDLDALLGGSPAGPDTTAAVPGPPPAGHAPGTGEPSSGGAGSATPEEVGRGKSERGRGGRKAGGQTEASRGRRTSGEGGEARRPAAPERSPDADAPPAPRTGSAGARPDRVRISIFVTEEERDALRIRAIENGYGNGVSAYVVDALGLAAKR